MSTIHLDTPSRLHSPNSSKPKFCYLILFKNPDVMFIPDFQEFVFKLINDGLKSL